MPKIKGLQCTNEFMVTSSDIFVESTACSVKLMCLVAFVTNVIFKQITTMCKIQSQFYKSKCLHIFNTHNLLCVKNYEKITRKLISRFSPPAKIKRKKKTSVFRV